VRPLSQKESHTKQKENKESKQSIHTHKTQKKTARDKKRDQKLKQKMANKIVNPYQ
jgi:hypothetical protein